MIPFSLREGIVTARFTKRESGLLVSLASQLVDLLDERSGSDAPPDELFDLAGIGGSPSLPQDPALARLLPDAFTADEPNAAEHRRLTERSLVQRKIANARRVIADLEGDHVALDDEGVNSWLRVLTDLRLVIAARLHIEHDGDEGDDPDLQWIYDWLGGLQGLLLEEIDE